MIRITKRHRAALFLLAFQTLVSYGAESQGGSSVPLYDLSGKIGAEMFWDPFSGIARLVKDGHTADMRIGNPVVIYDYGRAVSLDPPALVDGIPVVTAAFSRKLEDYFAALPPPSMYKVSAILIDPGHGGKDPGAVGTASVGGKTIQVKEKDIVLNVANQVYSALRSAYPDKRVLMTRTGDTYPTLEDRVELANGVKTGPNEAILYISIHANSAFNKSSSGFEVWYLSPDYRRTVIDKADAETSEILPILNSMMEEEFTTESILIAKSISDSLEVTIGDKSPNRGIKEESWFVVRNAKMPSVLIELGFVSNPAEAKLLSDEAYLKKCSTGIYNGLVNFIQHFEGSRGFTAAQ